MKNEECEKNAEGEGRGDESEGGLVQFGWLVG